MTTLLIIAGIVVLGLLAGLVYREGKRKALPVNTAESSEDIGFSCGHHANLAQLRQALDSADLEYVKNRVKPRAARRFREERRRIARCYLEALHEDFTRLMRAAQLVAALSPEVEATLEWRRFRLNLEFHLKYRILAAKFAMGAVPFAPLEKLATIVSSLAMDLERVINEIGAASLRGQEQPLSTR
ncbi:MAG: hypothetical protein JSS69_09110 [Acidobacteria bacterium]|nr:hypothetical protein [Acidobacteriota bacterium]MBS1866064.1 hypothetical protein [Acidobacteriota bacterium]